jgi:hypothetical protein
VTLDHRIFDSVFWLHYWRPMLSREGASGWWGGGIAGLQGVSDPPIIKFHDTELVNYNPGKKLVEFLNFQTLSPSPLIQCSYLGDMCCKSTWTYYLNQYCFGVEGGGVKVNSCFNWTMLTFSSYVFKQFGCIFRKVYRYFFQDCSTIMNTNCSILSWLYYH